MSHNDNLGYKVGSGLKASIKGTMGFFSKAKAKAKEFKEGFVEGFGDEFETKPEVKKEEPKACIVEVPKVGTVKYCQKDLDEIKAKQAKGIKLNRFQELVLQAQLHKA